MINELLIPSFTFTPLIMFTCAVAMIVLRAGASRIFFDVVGIFQAGRMVKDAESVATVIEAIYVDAFHGIQESAMEITESFDALLDATVPIAREIEEARIQFDKFLSEAERTPEVFEDISEIGLAFGFSADEAFEASARMAQLAGTLGQGTTPLGTEIGMQFGLISGMETEEGMQRLINLQQQTKFMTKDTENAANQQQRLNIMRSNSIEVLDQLNTVENRSAATMQQITYVMNQFASQAHLTGESIAAMAAMSATLIEAGEEQGKGGRALRMIYARLGADTNGARTTIEKLGISVIDAETGAMRPFSDILEELAQRYNSMNGAQQQQLAQQVAGNRHYTRLIKLLENVDRVRELEEEALTGMFPAMEEIERRRDTELFQLEQAEKQLRNYQAAFGETMIDNVRTGVEVQTQFYNMLNQTAEGPLGFFVDRFAKFGIVMKTAMGPTVQLMMAVYNLSLSFQTLKAIQKAAEEASAAGTSAHKNQYGQVQQNIHSHHLYVNALHELRKAEILRQKFSKTVAIPTTREEQAAVREQVLELQKEESRLIAVSKEHDKNIKILDNAIKATEDFALSLFGEAEANRDLQVELIETIRLRKEAFDAAALGPEAHEAGNKLRAAKDKLNAAKREGNRIDRDTEFTNNTLIAQQRTHTEQTKFRTETEKLLGGVKKDLHIQQHRYGLAEIKLTEQEAIAQQKKIDQQVAFNNQVNSLSAALMGAGMAFMFVGKSERAQRAGMMLNAASMALQIARMVAKASATLKDTYATYQNIQATETATISQGKHTMVTEMSTFAKLQFTLATKLATTGLMTFGTAAMVVSAGGLALLAGAAYLLAGLFKDVEDSALNMSTAILDLEEVNDIVAGMSLSAINSELETLNATIDRTKDATGALAKEQHDAAVDRRDQLLSAKDIKLMSDSGLLDVLKQVEEQDKILNDTLEKHNKTGLLSYIQYGDAAIRRTANTTHGIMMDNLEKNHGEYMAFIERTGVRSIEDLENFGEQATDTLAETTMDATTVIGAAFEDAKDEMYEFNNAREELFFGMNAGRVTGDLIRQVQQQGVENLITSTEVIMHNTFNGLTIPEMADRVIAEIESRGNKFGYSITS
mgnify:CR=1 FL=1